MARYEFHEGSSNKFWQIDLDGASFTTTFGKVGSSGQSSTKSFGSEAKAQAEHDKLVREKTGKGYTLVDAIGDLNAASQATARAAPAPRAEAAAPSPIKEAAAVAAAVASPAASVPASVPTQLEPATHEPKQPGKVHLMTEPLASLAAIQRRALQPKRLKVPAAEVSYRTLHEAFNAANIQKALEAGLDKKHALADLARAMIEQYSKPELPQSLRVDVEAFAFCLFHRVPLRKDGGKENRAAEVIVDFLVAHSGIAFTIEVLIETSWMQMRAETGLARDDLPRWVARARSMAPHVLCETEVLVSDHLASASEDERAKCRALAVKFSAHEALEAKAAAATLVPSAAASQAYLEARLAAEAKDAAEGNQDKERYSSVVFSIDAIALLSAADLVRYFEVISVAEILAISPPLPHEKNAQRYGRSAVAAILLDRLGLTGIAPLTLWLRGCLKPEESWELYKLHARMRELLEVLGCVANSQAVVDAAIAVMERLGGESIAKERDPRPAAFDVLATSPALAVEALRTAKFPSVRDWKQQLERLVSRNSAPKVPEADASEVPAILSSKAAFKAPSFWSPALLTPPQTRLQKALPPNAIETLGALLVKGDPVAIQQVKDTCDATSLCRFAWDLFQIWLNAGADSKHKWALLALGFFGDDDAARRLTALIRIWPGEAAHARAVLGLDVLAEMGSDVALMMLNGVAEKVKFKGLQDRAKEKMEEIAKKRGLTGDELADRLVPDLDLDDDGSKTLDFGPRSFRVGFDESLAPFVMDATGARLKDLPKPNSKDDAALAEPAVELWKGMKKSAKALAALQILRFELAMANSRRWGIGEFKMFFVEHPLLTHLVRRLVWGIFSDMGALVTTFRVAEDRSLADKNDDVLTVRDDARVGLVHKLNLSEGDIKAWQKVFGDYELVQPFDQLTRATYALDASQHDGESITRFKKRKVETKKVMGLLSRGWRRGPAEDGGVAHLVYKPIARDLYAVLDVDGGIYIGAMDYGPTELGLGAISFTRTAPDAWSTAPRTSIRIGEEVSWLIASELVRDIESLGQVSSEE
jgi:predicted DNA-binding WGR domain protein